MADYRKLFDAIDDIESVISAVNDEVWEYAELYFKETRSADALIRVAEQYGFTTVKGIAGIPTAFYSKWGDKGPRIGFLAEYDALDALNQKCGVPVREPSEGHTESQPGHGCGHNSLGAGSLAASIGLKKYCEETGTDAQIYFFGCPGEENGSGKVFMARDGFFDDMDICITWHPGSANEVTGTSSLACLSIKYKFHGIASHAAAVPHLGRSALDACEIMNVGVNYLREHIIPERRIHYSYLNAGGVSPNVVQDYACTYYFVRAPKVTQALEIRDRVDNIARGAALITGTRAEIIRMDGLADYIPNKVLGDVMVESMKEIPLPSYTEEELRMAKAYAATVPEADLLNARKKLAAKNHVDVSHYDNVWLDDLIAPYVHNPDLHEPGSTDVGDVSYCAPTVQCHCATVIVGTPGHSWQMTGQGATSYAHKGVIYAAKVMALTALKAIQDPSIIEKARAEYHVSCPDGYICPTDPDYMPDLGQY